MKNAKLTDKTDNYRILSVYIDNIMRKTENHEQQNNADEDPGGELFILLEPFVAYQIKQ